jgi:transposase
MFPGVGAPDGCVVVNERCLVRTEDRRRVVLVSGLAMAQYEVGDTCSEAHAMVSLVEQGLAAQREVARAFECTTRTVRRHQRRFVEGGLEALGRHAGYPRGRARVPETRERLVNRLKAAGASTREIARKVGVDEKAIRKLLRRLGWKPPEAVQLDLQLAADPVLSGPPAAAPAAPPPAPATGADPNGSAPTAAAPATPSPASAAGADPNLSAAPLEEDLPFTSDTNPADRSVDRLLACIGLLDDAAPLFREGEQVPRAGVLLALPALVGSGIFDIARDIYGTIGPAFYGLRTTLVATLLMALLRIKRPEALKEHSPADLGRLLGLDRAPEVKTLRRKLSRLAAYGQAAAFGRALASRRVASLGEALGFLYVDGHVRVYHGRHTLPKTHVARMRLAMPATSDYWVNDEKGEPLFVLTAQANAGMVKMLPIVLDEVRRLVGQRRLTIVFDRGGWSPKLFVKLLAANFDILTYRKGRFRRVPKRDFVRYRAVFNGQKVDYLLADKRVRFLKGTLALRQITRLAENDSHQTPIITSLFDLPPALVAFRMFGRWKQENFFKYLREEYALDALVDYRVEPDDPTREVPNPRRLALDEPLREARAELARLRAEYGIKAFSNPERLRRTMRGFKNATAKVGDAIWRAIHHVRKLERRRARMPVRVPVRKAIDAPIVKLATERKHLTNLFKMVAFQAESDLLRLLAPHYPRVEDEGRTLIQSALNGTASIALTDSELRVTLAPLSSPHRSRALRAVCDELNRIPTRFPGSRLTLRYAVQDVPE